MKAKLLVFLIVLTAVLLNLNQHPLYYAMKGGHMIYTKINTEQIGTLSPEASAFLKIIGLYKDLPIPSTSIAYVVIFDLKLYRG